MDTHEEIDEFDEGHGASMQTDTAPPKPVVFDSHEDTFYTKAGDYPALADWLLDTVLPAMGGGDDTIPNITGNAIDDMVFDIMRRLIVKVPGQFMIRNIRTQTWEGIDSADIVAAINQRFPQFLNTRRNWFDAKTKKVVTKPPYSEDYIRKNVYTTMSGVIRSGTVGTLTEVDGGHVLNVGIPPTPAGAPDMVDHADTRQLIELVTRNLLGDDRPVDVILEGIRSRTSHPTTWAFHWFAHVRQFPFEPLSTCLWLHSYTHGIGKSSFVTDVLQSIVADFRSGSAKEVASDWDDWVLNEHLCYLDEPTDGLDGRGRANVLAFIKRHVGNAMISPRRRHQGSVGRRVRATASFILTTNQADPVPFEAGDRRSTFISGAKPDQADAAKARLNAWIDIGADRRRAAIAGFAAILDTVEIDTVMLRTCYDTAEKYAAVEVHQPPFIQWLESESGWAEGAKLNMRDIDHLFALWCDDHNVKVNRATARLEGVRFGIQYGYLSDRTSHTVKSYYGRGAARAYTLMKRPGEQPTERTVVAGMEQVDLK